MDAAAIESADCVCHKESFILHSLPFFFFF